MIYGLYEFLKLLSHYQSSGYSRLREVFDEFLFECH